MTNQERRDYLLQEAGKEYREMNTAWEEKDWNRVIRKAQETIELNLKAVLKYMNVEFPKEHDIAKYFEKIITQKGIKFDLETMGKIKDLSSELTGKRAPAYYGEEFYSEEEALRAKDGTEIVIKFVKELLEGF